MTESRRILITGANGFLGGALCRYFTQRGYSVRSLVRNPLKNRYIEIDAKEEVYQCDLPDNIDEAAFEGENLALIHCAYASQTTDRKEVEAINVLGTRRLLTMTRKHQVERFVFISSLSAHADAASAYGQSKFRLEQELDPDRDLILRPGLIIGQGGLFGRLRQSLRRLPLVPQFYGGNQRIQYIGIDDLCSGLHHVLEQKLSGAYNVAAATALPLADFYRRVAHSVGRRCYFVPFPARASIAILKGVERLGLSLPVTSENILGLKEMRVFQTQKDLTTLELDPQSLDQLLENKKR